MSHHHVGQGVDGCLVAVQRLASNEVGDAGLLRHLRKADVDLVQRLDVVGRECDRYDDHVLATSLAQRFDSLRS